MPSWDPLMKIGVPVLDRQHEELFRQLDELGLAMKRGKGSEAIGDLLAFLSHYVDGHFRAEEGLMGHHEYPGLGQQQSLHGAFKRELTGHVEAFAANPAEHSLTIEIHRWGMSWLRDHILNIDAEFGEYFREKGIVVGGAG